MAYAERYYCCDVSVLISATFPFSTLTLLSTTSKKERIQEYLDTAKVPDLTANEIKSIDENGEHKRFFVSVPLGLVFQCSLERIMQSDPRLGLR